MSWSVNDSAAAAPGTTPSPEIVALIPRSVQEATTAERARWSDPEVCQSSQALSSFSIPGDAGGVSSALDLSATSFLASGAGFQGPNPPQGRPSCYSIVCFDVRCSDNVAHSVCLSSWYWIWSSINYLFSALIAIEADQYGLRMIMLSATTQRRQNWPTGRPWTFSGSILMLLRLLFASHRRNRKPVMNLLAPSFPLWRAASRGIGAVHGPLFRVLPIVVACALARPWARWTICS